MGKNASSRLRRLCGLMLAFFALLATTIIMPTLNAHPLTVYAATRGHTLVKAAVTLTPPTATTTVPTPSPTPTTPPSYQLSVRPDPLSQDTRSCTATTPSDYSCFVTLTITPALPATATVTWDAGILGGGVLTGSDFPATVSITNLACPGAATSITFTAIISANGIVLQSPTAADQWSCVIPPTATPSPTPTTAPTPTSTSAPSPTPGATQSPSPGSTPGTTPSPSATGTSTLPTAMPTVCSSPGTVKTSASCKPTPRTASNTPTKTTQGTQGTQGAASTPSPTTNQTGVGSTDSGGKNDPPSSGNNGPLFLIASLTLAALAFLLYLLSWGQSSIGERILSLVLPVALLRRMRK